MNKSVLDINNENKGYLDEKELFILYSILKKKHISTIWSNIFTPNGNKHIHISQDIDSNEAIKDFEQKVNEDFKKIESKKQSSVVLSYLLELGKELDEKDFSIYCNADYSLVEGGFLCDYKDGKTIPIKEYKKAILNKKADKNFIELVNKLITKHDSSKWNKNDVVKFLEIYYKHNKEKFQNELKKFHNSEKVNLFDEDIQTELAKLIFEHIDIHLSIKNTKKLEQYLLEYINLFKNDKLNSFSKYGLTNNFFSSGLTISLNTKFFGYKKQKDILLEHITNTYEKYQRNDIEIGNPYIKPEYIGDQKNDEVKFTLSEINEEKELFLFVHTMIALEHDKQIEIEDFSYGPTALFDLYDRGFLFKINYTDSIKEVKELEIENKNKKIVKKITPFLITENKKGYLKFFKEGEKIHIGNIKTRKFKLLQVLIEPPDTISVARNTEAVFEAIKLPKDKRNIDLNDNYLAQNKQIMLIEYTIKEIQKIKKLQGKIHFSFDNNKKKIRLEFNTLEGI